MSLSLRCAALHSLTHSLSVRIFSSIVTSSRFLFWVRQVPSHSLFSACVCLTVQYPNRVDRPPKLSMVHREIERWLCLCRSAIFYLVENLLPSPKWRLDRAHTWIELAAVTCVRATCSTLVEFSVFFLLCFASLILMLLVAATSECKRCALQSQWRKHLIQCVCVSVRSANTRHNLHSINLFSFFFFSIFARIAKLHGKSLMFLVSVAMQFLFKLRQLHKITSVRCSSLRWTVFLHSTNVK